MIVGMVGAQGRLLARRLLREHEVVGVDLGAWTARIPRVPFYQVDVRKRAFVEVLRKERPVGVVHLGQVRHFRGDAEERYDVNVRGTRLLLDRCLEHGVRKVVILSSSYVYGAFPENPGFMNEDHPISGSRSYPEIRDLVEVDTLATAFMWKHPELAVSILRPAPTLGRYVTSSIATYLRMRRVILLMGFNPMTQFIHEADVVEALATALRRGVRGVFNLTGPGEVPLRLAVGESGGKPLVLPELIARPLIGRLFRLGVFPFPPGALDFIKYPCTIDGSRFVAETGFRPQFDLKETFRSLF